MPFRLAITIAGAVSLGSFEAGVLFEIFDALAQHNRASPPESKICVDVLTGASAGGMTAAVAAQSLLYSSRAIAEPYNNAFYSAWVAGVDIDGLLPRDSGEPANQSVLSSNFVWGLAENFLLGRYTQEVSPPPVRHPALPPSGAIRLGLALSNLTGVDYQRPQLSGGTFNYTRFQDQVEFLLDGTTDRKDSWNPVAHAAVACGAFPFAFRPRDLIREIADFKSPFLAPWPSSPRAFTYTDGGVFQNQPLGLAKNLVDLIDQHQDTDTRSYLFVSPSPLNSTAGTIREATANFKALIDALLNAVYNQAGFQDWIAAESVNAAVDVLNLRASQLSDLFKRGVLQVGPMRTVLDPLLSQFKPSESDLLKARTQLHEQFSSEFEELSSSLGPTTAEVWIDSVLLLELAAELHEKDEMYIYSITADSRDLAGAGLFSFLGFLDRGFREHDYDLGREKAQSFLTRLKQISRGKLPELAYLPKPHHPIQPTPVGGFTPAMIAEEKREDLYHALSEAADNLLEEEGLNWIERKGVEALYLNGKIKKMLGL